MVRIEPTGELLVAGAYAQQFGSLNQQLTCTCARLECFCGFSAHVTMAGALRYRPLTDPIAVVELGGFLRPAGGPRAPYWVAATQKVLGIGFPTLCEPECDSAAEGLRTASTDGTASPACRDHGGSLSLAALSEDVGVGVFWLSDDYACWARNKLVMPAPTRCSCALVRDVSVASGLAHYVRDLWNIGGQLPGPEKAFAATCRSCRQLWRYDRSLGTGSKM